MLVSVSRRCDIPRFAFGWFLERLNEGFVEVKNPFNPRQIRRVSLVPAGLEGSAEEGVEIFAFWTRDPASILEHSDELEKRGYSFFVMCSLTAYPPVLEPNAPPADSVIKTMKLLAERNPGGIGRVIWRYDPIFLSDKSDYEFHRQNFADLAARLNGAAKRVIVSVYDEYAKAEKRLAGLEQAGALKRLPHYESGQEGKALHSALQDLLKELAFIAQGEGMEIQSCAELDLTMLGIKKGACIDGEYIASEFGLKAPPKDRSQRPNCLCAQSVDIGSYGPCPAGCVYCYASG